MKKLLKQFTIIVLMLLLAFNMTGCGFLFGVFEECDTYESDYYIYQVPVKNREIAYIIGLTDLGKEQEYLIIPETIGNKRVVRITTMIPDLKSVKSIYKDTIYVNYKSTKLKKVFMPFNITAQVGLAYFFGDKEVFYLDNDSDYPYSCFVTNTKGRGEPFYDFMSGGHKFSANVSYFYNYENAKNDGYYWIDYYAYGEKIEYIPENPTRDGYTFDGWYKESECINKWNFEVDTLPELQYEEGIIYQETKLYAKWIEYYSEFFA